MIFAKVQVSGIHALTESGKTIPAGLIGGKIEFDFVDSRWDNLTKTIVFQGCETRDVLLDGNTAIIPQEVVARPGALLLVGVYGTDAENSIAIPTMWAVIGEVQPAADPSGDPAADPSLPIWAELEDRMDELEKNLDEQVESSVMDYLEQNPPSGGVDFETDDTLRLENGILSVNKDAINAVSDEEIAQLNALMQ